MTWNDERVDALKKLWADGLSASQIAGRLGGVTRNAVIGKVHRLGLAGRATTSRMKSPRSSRVRAAHAAKRMMRARQPAVGNSPLRNLYLGETEPYVPAAEELVIPLNERKYIQTLTESCCRWPIGDPQQPEFHFCGKKKIPGLPYCEVHARRAAAQGAVGTICGLGNVLPQAMRRYLDAAEAEAERWRALIAAVDAAICATPFLPACKAAIALATGEEGWRRVVPPLASLDDPGVERLRAALADIAGRHGLV